MKFGFAEQSELDQIDFQLGPTHPETGRVLGGKLFEKPEIYIGCGKWGISQWVGKIYPEGTKSSDFLSAYKDVFNSVELNNTFYRLNRDAIREWTKIVEGTNFKFCPKLSRRISHLKRLNDVAENTQYFIESVMAFGKHLGPSFLQMPDNFTPKYLDRFVSWLPLIPREFPLFIEVRHKEWFEAIVFGELCDLLESCGVGLVITDTANRRDVVHQRLTRKEVLIRFNGYGLHPTDFLRLNSWAERLKEWIEQGLQKIYFFGHQEDEAMTPDICGYIKDQLTIASK